MHPNSLKNLKKGTKFSSEHQPEKNGRKPSRLKGMIESNDLSSNDVSDLLLSLFDKTEEELKKISFDQEQPFLIRAFVKAMLKDMAQDGIYNINNLLDRAVGKAKETKEIQIEDITENTLSREEKIARLKKAGIQLDEIGS